MTVLAIAPMHNSPGKKDATGAFLPEAREFLKIHGGQLLTFDNRRGSTSRALEVLDGLETYRRRPKLSGVAFFCHGTKTGLQTGVHISALGPRKLSVWAETLASILQPTAPVVLYACDAARDDDNDRDDDTQEGPGGAGGFASRLAGALGEHGWQGWVDAHTTTAHTTKNPFLRRFYASDLTEDGIWLVEPRSKKWNAWRRALRDDRVFRLSFPFWSAEELHEKRL